MPASTTHPGKFRGISRGVFGLKSWDPLPRPGEPAPGRDVASIAPTPGRGATPVGQAPPQLQQHRPGVPAPQQPQKPQPQPDPAAGGDRGVTTQHAQQNKAKPNNKGPRPESPMVAKYSYKANPNSPLENELTVTQKDKLKFIEVHEMNEQWWKVQNDAGQEGYIPATYCMEIKITSLPWLPPPEELPEVGAEPQGTGGVFGLPPKAAYKPYQPSYSHASLGITAPKRDEPSAAVEDFACHLCDKKLNGPMPYRMHMASKAHKENVEVAQEEGWLHEVKGYEHEKA